MKPDSPRKPVHTPVPGPSGADAVHPAPDAHVVGNAAGAGPGPAGASGNSGGTDWLDEMRLPSSQAGGGADAVPQGVPVSTRTRGDQRRGKAIESKRGQR